TAVHQDALGLPGGQRGQLLGVGRAIANDLESIHREYGRGRVVAVGAAGPGGKARNNDVGPEGANDAHHVAQDLLPVPDSEGLGVILGNAKVEGPGEELACAVQTPGGEQLLRAEDAEGFAELGAEQVLPAVAAGDRKVGGAATAAAREVGEKGRVF